MQSLIFPATQKASKRNDWLKIAYSSNTYKKIFNALYIGVNGGFISKLNDIHSVENVSVANYSEAEKYLNSTINNRSSVDVIIIDVPLDLKQLEKFAQIRKLKNFSKISLVYNSEWLKSNESEILQQLELIDNTIHLESDDIFEMISQETELKSQNIRIQMDRMDINFDVKEKLKQFSFQLKKAFDIVVAFVIIIFLLPVFVVTAIAIKLESRGPVFYSSPRAGRGYRIFQFYKFRSMVVDADKQVEALSHLNQYDVKNEGPVFFKVDNDPRITKVGQFLRNTSLDELPQLFNVLKGDMSLVGNRPLPLYEAKTLTTNKYVERFDAPAGITGLWQVEKRGKADMSVEERMNLDIMYARKASPLFDLYIMFRTPAALFQKSNA